MAKKKIVCITGMERSGTSMVARIVNLLGVYLGGRDDLIMETDYNQKGCWENKTFLNISDEILKRFGGDTHSMPDFPDGWINDPRIADLVAEARKTIAREFSKKDVWGWKDPRCCLVMPFWQNLLPEINYIICIRNPSDVANSLVSRQWVSSYREAYYAWHMYTSNIIRHTSGKRRIFVFYEDFMGSDPLAAIRRLARFLGRGYVKRLEDSSSDIEAFITKGLQHHETPLLESLEDAKMPLSVKAYYLCLILLVQGGIKSLNGMRSEEALDTISLYTDERLASLTDLDRTKKALEEKTQRIEALLNSTSWRITAPLRKSLDLIYAIKKDKKGS